MEGWGDAYPELRERAAEVRDVLGAEAEQFARTLTQGRRLLAEVIDRSRASGRCRRDDAFRLHDTYGFPLDLTLEAAQRRRPGGGRRGLRAPHGRTSASARARAGDGAGGDGRWPSGPRSLARDVGRQPSSWAGTRRALDTRVTAVDELGDGEALLKLERSPFYAEGGGQVSDIGEIAGRPAGAPRSMDAYRVGADQVLRVRLEEGELPRGRAR